MARKAEPDAARRAATEIVKTLRAAGHTAYFAGGCVRDELLGLSPTDYDVATDATPDRIRALFKRTDEVGAAFGVVLVTLPVGEKSGPGGGGRAKATVEVATFRSDGPYSDRRRPDVIHFSDAQSDARRRDFTVNALFLDPLAEDGARGRVIDYVNGMADIRAKVLRAVGDPDARLAEDHLRALRAVRLAAKLGLAVDPATEAAIRRHSSELTGVSRERIGEEIRRVMSHPSRGRAVDLLTRLGLDAPVLREPHRDAAGPARVLAGVPAEAPVALGLAAWALDRSRPGSPPPGLPGRWREALMLSNDETAALQGTLRTLETLREGWLVSGVAVQKREAARPEAAWALTLLSLAEPGTGAKVTARVRELSGDGVGLSPAPLIDGDELVRMGMAPGPRFKRILDGVYDAQLEGRVRTLEAARSLAGELARSPGVQ